MSLMNRHIQPKYEHPFCSVARIESVNCGFAKQVYNRYLDNKFGVENCVEDRYDDFFVKKMMLNLDLLFDPKACVIEQDLCFAPEDVIVSIYIFEPNDCKAPINPNVTVDFPYFPGCFAPEDAVATISFNK